MAEKRPIPSLLPSQNHYLWDFEFVKIPLSRHSGESRNPDR
jgi:hypothetical protein